jgi:hypothetical protein
MNSCEFKEIIDEDFEVKNGVLGLHRDTYLHIVKLLDCSILRKVSKYYFVNFLFSTLGLVRNLMNKRNTFTS